jgi:hypothetical protein
MKEFFIKPENIGNYTKKNNNRVFKLLLWSTVISGVIISLSLSKSLNTKVLLAILANFLFMFLLIGFLYWNNKKFTRLVADNLKIVIDESSISRVLDMDNEPRMNILHKYGHAKYKTMNGGFINKIKLTDIKKIAYKKDDLWIYGRNSNSFNGKNILSVPREIEGFDEIESLVKQYLDKNKQ